MPAGRDRRRRSSIFQQCGDLSRAIIPDLLLQQPGLKRNELTRFLGATKNSGHVQSSAEDSAPDRRSLHLVSLPPLILSDDVAEATGAESQSSQCTRYLWQWKGAVYGDGGVYFGTRPMAIAALNALLGGRDISWVDDDGPMSATIEGCAVLANCARMDVLLSVKVMAVGPVMDAVSADKLDSRAGREALRAVAACLAAQLLSFRRKRFKWFHRVLSTLKERRQMIDPDADEGVRSSPSTSLVHSELSDSLESALVYTGGVYDVSRHFCLVAAGLQSRPRHPDRVIRFGPFSSWDAHIMKQIKLAAEASASVGCCTREIKTVLDVALQAGKAARSPKVVPELYELRECSGSRGEPPRDLVIAASDAAVALAVEPAAKRCEARLRAMEAGESVAGLRQTVRDALEEMGVDMQSDSGRAARTMLHQPTLDMREGRGDTINVDELLASIRTKIEHQSKIM